MHTKLTANLIAKRSEERNKKIGKRDLTTQGLSGVDFLKALAPRPGKESKGTNKSEISRCITFQSRMGDSDDPLLFGVSMSKDEELSKNKSLNSNELLALQADGPNTQTGLFFHKKSNLNLPKINIIEVEDQFEKPLNEDGNSQTTFLHVEEEKNSQEINLVNNATEINSQQVGSPKITARQRWKRAITKIMVLRKFNMLNENLKVDAKLYGRVTESLTHKIETNTSCVILPDSKSKIGWSFIMVLALIFTAIYIPIRIAYLENISTGLLIVEFAVDGIFILDLALNFFSAYYEQDKRLITNNRIIAKRYLKGWFALDLMAWYILKILYIGYYKLSFPFGIIEIFTGQNEMGYNRLLRLIRLSRLYRIIKIFNLLRVLKVLKKNKTYEKFLIAMKMNTGIKRLIKTIFTFFLVMHFFGCFWFFVARFNDFEPDTWVMRNGIRDMPPMHQYLISFCWVMTLSTIGYGDIIPFTKTERFISLFYIIVGVGFVSYSIGSLSSIMLSSDSKKQKYKEKILVLDELAMNLKMNGDLYYKIKSIIRNNHETHFYSDMSHDTLLEELPTSLRSELITLIYQQNNLGVIAFFHGKDPEFLNEIMPHLRRITLEKDEIIYRDGDWADEMYFILSGSVKLVSDDNYIFRTYITGSYFGECEIIKKTDFRNESAIATEACELLTLRKADLNRLLDVHVNVRKQFTTVLQKREAKNVESLENARRSSLKIRGLLLERLTCGKKSIFNAAEIAKVDKRRGSVWRRIESPIEMEIPSSEVIDEESSSDSLVLEPTPAFNNENPQNFEESIDLDKYLLGDNKSESMDKESISQDHYSFTSEGRDSMQEIDTYAFKPKANELDNPPANSLSRLVNKHIREEAKSSEIKSRMETVRSKFELSPLALAEEIKDIDQDPYTSIVSRNIENMKSGDEFSSFSVSERMGNGSFLLINNNNNNNNNIKNQIADKVQLVDQEAKCISSKSDLSSIRREFYKLKREVKKCQKLINLHKTYDITRWRELREELSLKKLDTLKVNQATYNQLNYAHSAPINRQATDAAHSFDYKDWLRKQSKKNYD